MKKPTTYQLYRLPAFLALAAGILLSSCAKQISPTGGAKDEAPPKLDSLKSTPNEQTNFEKQDLYFGFDEWVVVKNPFQQVIISPPLAEFPEIKTKGKGVAVIFDGQEEFLENTTYTINFGESIQDLNEGNVLENFTYVFSTGPIIDSLTIDGKVVDAREKEPMEGVLVMLYDQLEDSVIYKERPVYFAKTAKNGTFTITNIRQGRFLLRALKDENLNYTYDLPAEWIAFIDPPINISGNQTYPPFRITVFQKETPIAVNGVIANRFGLVKVALNQTLPGALLQPMQEVSGFEFFHEKDTLYGWYQSFPDSTLQLRVEAAGWTDTVTIGPFEEADRANRPGFAFLNANSRSGAGRTPMAPLTFSFSNPVGAVDTTALTIIEDSTRIPITRVAIDSADKRKIHLEAPWKEAGVYQLEALPGAFTDIFDQPSPDTIEVSLKNSELKNFGNIILSMKDLDPQKNYLVRLMDKETLVESASVTGDTAWTKTYSLLPPKTYSVELIEDQNGNGKWDTGDYDAKRRPEPILISDLESLRAGWDVTAEIKPEGN